MPPKRKRAENAGETSSRVTRASARSTRAADGDSNVASPEVTVRSSKKAKTTNTNATGTKGKQKKQKAGQDTTVEVAPEEPPACNNDTNTDVGKREIEKVKEKPIHKSRNAAVTKYDPKRALDIFTSYADADNPGLVGPEGFEKLCNDAQISMDGALPFVLSWQVGAEEMGKLTREGWIKGTDTLKISSLSQFNILVREITDLLILGRPPLSRPASKSNKESKEPYDRAKYWGYAEKPNHAFQELYMYCFSLVKPPPSKNIDMETATTLWSVLLVPRYPLMGEVVAFIADKNSTYKAVNKDLWSMMLEFCQTVDADLQGYDPDAAWPTLLDDFVASKKGIPAD